MVFILTGQLLRRTAAFLQDAGTILLDLLGCQPFLKIFKDVEQFCQTLPVLVRVLLDRLADAKKAMESFKERDAELMLTDNLAGLEAILQRAEKLLRLVACVLGMDLPEDMPEISSADFTWLLEKMPTTNPEKAFREVISTSQSGRLFARRSSGLLLRRRSCSRSAPG